MFRRAVGQTVGMITEDQLDQLCLGWFRDQGYDAVYGPDIAPEGDHAERSDYRQVILQGRLLLSRKSIPAFQRRNLKTSWRQSPSPSTRC